MSDAYVKPSTRAVLFAETGDARVPYEALVDGARWTVRINEFPDSPSLFTLLVDGVVSEELLSWPPAWTRPGDPHEDAHERAEAERELAHAERTRHIKPSKLVK